jgi:hypothetical protein
MVIHDTNVRTRKRRDELEQIRQLEAKIKAVEARKEKRKRRTESPVWKDFEKLKRQMARFAQVCMNHQRADIANSVLGFMTVLERQSREVRDTDIEDDDEESPTVAALDDVDA